MFPYFSTIKELIFSGLLFIIMSTGVFFVADADTGDVLGAQTTSYGTQIGLIIAGACVLVAVAAFIYIMQKKQQKPEKSNPQVL